MTITETLFGLRDEGYAAFTARLLPTIDPARVIGVRAPAVRRLARELRGSAEADLFLASLPHHYLEENALHAALLEGVKDFDQALHQVELFLPHVDNWATCDSLSPRVFGHQAERLLPSVERWLDAEHQYTVRFGIGMLMRHFLDAPRFAPCHLQRVAAIECDEYYIRMMQAWYLATALAKQPSATMPYMEPGRVGEWVRRKAIQKACESYRVPDATKARLRAMR